MLVLVTMEILTSLMKLSLSNSSQNKFNNLLRKSTKQGSNYRADNSSNVILINSIWMSWEVEEKVQKSSEEVVSLTCYAHNTSHLFTACVRVRKKEKWCFANVVLNGTIKNASISHSRTLIRDSSAIIAEYSSSSNGKQLKRSRVVVQIVIWQKLKCH